MISCRPSFPAILAPLLAILVVAAASAGTAAAQERCEFIEGSGNLQTVDGGSGRITYVSTPNLVCRDGVRIRADSAVSFQASNYVQLTGRVRFEDPERTLTARSAEYFTTVGRLQAHGGAELVQKADSSVARGEEMIYNRAGPDRARAQLDLYGNRPTARLYVRRRADTATAQPDRTAAPYDVEADRILIEGDEYFRATGQVDVGRDDLQAYGDSVEYDQIAGTLRLAAGARAGARMVLNGRVLTAQVISAVLPDDQVREVVARRRAVLTAEDITLRAPVVRMFFVDGVMERLVAVPLAPDVPPPDALPAVEPPPTDEDRARPVATAQRVRIVADSLEVLAPGEVLDRIHATGSARAESSARDSLNTPDTPTIARSNWLEGDTLVAYFVREPPPEGAAGAAADSARNDYQLERLTAVGRARSLYRLEPNDSARARGERRLSFHYVTAQSILLDLDEGEVTRMEVRGQTEGVHVDPFGAPAKDTLAAPGDTASTGVTGLLARPPAPLPAPSGRGPKEAPPLHGSRSSMVIP